MLRRSCHAIPEAVPNRCTPIDVSRSSARGATTPTDRSAAAPTVAARSARRASSGPSWATTMSTTRSTQATCLHSPSRVRRPSVPSAQESRSSRVRSRPNIRSWSSVSVQDTNTRQVSAGLAADATCRSTSARSSSRATSSSDPHDDTAASRTVRSGCVAAGEQSSPGRSLASVRAPNATRGSGSVSRSSQADLHEWNDSLVDAPPGVRRNTRRNRHRSTSGQPGRPHTLTDPVWRGSAQDAPCGGNPARVRGRSE